MKKGKYKRPKRKPRWLPLGTISEGSHHYENVMPALLHAAKQVRLIGDHWPQVCAIGGDYNSNHDGMRRWHKAHPDETDDIERDIQEHQQEQVEDLILILNNYTPPFTDLGYHEGDGADLGVWINNEVPLHGSQTDEIAKGRDLPQASMVVQDYFLQVNDHRNSTLWVKRRYGKSVGWVQVWSIV